MSRRQACPLARPLALGTLALGSATEARFRRRSDATQRPRLLLVLGRLALRAGGRR
jgi:hypothetical protein